MICGTLKRAFVVFILLVIAGGVGLVYFLFFRANPFCDPSLCPPGVPHIGCNGTDWGPTCVDPEIIKIVSATENKILDLHNELRNRVASGTMTNKFQETFPMANRMGILSWNDDLAYLAKVNTYQCKMNHDKCRNTKEFKFSGQNLAYTTVRLPLDEVKMIAQMVNAWFSEYKDTQIAVIKKYQKVKEKVGHFTVMVHDLQTHVGCGMTMSIVNKREVLLFACNYSYNNMMGQAIYKSDGSNTPCRGCKKGCHPKYKFLCGKGEDIKPE